MTRPLYCDEGVWVPIADGLRNRGWEVHTARSEQMLGSPDEKHLELVNDNDWILFTFDDDFLSLVSAESYDHAGIVFTNQSEKRVGELVKAVDAFLETVDDGWRGIHYL